MAYIDDKVGTRISIGLISDLANYTDKEVLVQYIDQLFANIFNVLNANCDAETKTGALIALGDMWMTCEEGFNGYTQKAMECLSGAENACLTDTTGMDEDT